VDHAAQPPDYDPWPLVRAFLCLDAADLELGAPGAVFVGGIAGRVARGAREARVQHKLLLSISREPVWWESGSCVCEGLAGKPNDAAYAGSLPSEPGFVVRTDLYRVVHRGSGAAEKVSRSPLSLQTQGC